MSDSKALEFAEYLAKAAERYIVTVNNAAVILDALNYADPYDNDLCQRLRRELDATNIEETDRMRSLAICIYEFRKRAQREKS